MATRTRKKIDGDVDEAISRLAYSGWTPSQIHRHLESNPDLQGRVPTLRTIQRKVSEIGPRDGSAKWTLGESDGRELSDILDVLRDVIRDTEGKIREFTTAEAELIGRIRAARPSIPSRTLWVLARLYLQRFAEKQPTADLDQFVAFAPWQDPESRNWYFSLVHLGQVDLAPPSITQKLAFDFINAVSRNSPYKGAKTLHSEYVQSIAQSVLGSRASEEVKDGQEARTE